MERERLFHLNCSWRDRIAQQCNGKKLLLRGRSTGERDKRSYGGEKRENRVVYAYNTEMYMCLSELNYENSPALGALQGENSIIRQNKAIDCDENDGECLLIGR